MTNLKKPGVDFNNPAAYEIIVSGTFTAESYDDVLGLSVKCSYLGGEKEITVVTGLFANQAELGKLLNLIYELHLPIIAVRRIPG